MEIKLCENIRALRQSRGINQETLAGALSVSTQAVSKWETGASLPDVAMIPRIAEYFGVTTDFLFFGGEMPAAPEKEPASPFPDDGVLRAVLYQGSQLLDAVDATMPIRLRMPGTAEETISRPVQVEIHGSAQIEGSINGSVAAQGDLTCRTVNGSAHAGGNLHCERVNGFTGSRDFDLGGELNHIFDSVGSSLKRAFGGRKSKAVPNLPFPDDGVLRVVQFIGQAPATWEEPTAPIPLEIELAAEQGSGRPLSVEIYGDASVSGDITGNLTADGDVQCGNVGGSLQADGDVTCGDVGNKLTADGDVSCGNVGGSITADGDVSCGGSVGGSITTDGDVTCGGEVFGSITADGDVSCGNVGGSISCEGDLHCGNITGDVRSCEGDITCGEIHGSVRCEGNVTRG